LFVTGRIAKTGNVKLEIYDLLGRNVTTLLNRNVAAGSFQVKWNGFDDFGSLAASGIYIYQLESGGIILQKKMTFLR